MLLESVLLASLVSVASGSSALGLTLRRAPMWASYALAVQAPWRALQLRPPCSRSRAKRVLPCAALSVAPLRLSIPALGSYAEPDVQLPSMSDEMGGTLGGYVNFDVMRASGVQAGPQVSWLTPDSPREDLLRLRVVAPGWGVRYTWKEAAISVGVAACTRLVMLGEDWPVVDMLTSEARIEFLLP